MSLLGGPEAGPGGLSCGLGEERKGPKTMEYQKLFRLGDGARVDPMAEQALWIPISESQQSIFWVSDQHNSGELNSGLGQRCMRAS